MKNRNRKISIISTLALEVLFVIIFGCSKESTNLVDSRKQSESVSKTQAKFVAISGSELVVHDSDRAAYSEDGINWKAAKMPDEVGWASVCFSGEKCGKKFIH